MDDIQRHVGLLEFVEQHGHHQNDPVHPLIAQFVDRTLGVQWEPKLIHETTPGNREPSRVEMSSLIPRLEGEGVTPEMMRLFAEWYSEEWLSAINRYFTIPQPILFGPHQHEPPRATVVDDIDAEFESR